MDTYDKKLIYEVKKYSSQGKLSVFQKNMIFCFIQNLST